MDIGIGGVVIIWAAFFFGNVIYVKLSLLSGLVKEVFVIIAKNLPATVIYQLIRLKKKLYTFVQSAYQNQPLCKSIIPVLRFQK